MLRQHRQSTTNPVPEKLLLACVEGPLQWHAAQSPTQVLFASPAVFPRVLSEQDDRLMMAPRVLKLPCLRRFVVSPSNRHLRASGPSARLPNETTAPREKRCENS